MTKINRSIFFKTNNFLPSPKNRQLSNKFEKKKKNLPPVNLTLKIHVYVLENLWINGGGGGLERRVRTTANMYREINSCQCKRSYDVCAARNHGVIVPTQGTFPLLGGRKLACSRFQSERFRKKR